jgi:hypothetical protein
MPRINKVYLVWRFEDLLLSLLNIKEVNKNHCFDGMARKRCRNVWCLFQVGRASVAAFVPWQ